MERSKTNSGFLYFLEKIIRSHPLLYFIIRYFIRYTNVFEEDANGVAFLNLNKKVNIIDVGASEGIASKFFNRKPIIVSYEENSYVDFTTKLSAIEITEPYFSQLEIYKSQNDKGYKVSIDGHGADECLGG